MQQLSVILAIPALLACPALAAAQTRDTVTVDATATLAAPPPVLSIDGTGNLRFGRVSAPAEKGVDLCEYRIGFDGSLSAFADGARVYGGACQFLSENQNRAIVTIGCEAGHIVTFSYGTDSPYQANGVAISIDGGDIGLEDPMLGTAEQRVTCPANGRMVFMSGARLGVLRTANVPTGELVVGRIIVDFAYEATCYCG